MVEAEHGTEPVPAADHVCLNCDTTLLGPYCHLCGQSADDHHRSIRRLLHEAAEGLTEWDGRMAQTIPALFLWPGRLARDYLEGRRARHVPAFRLFLVALVIFMTVMEFRIGALVHLHPGDPGVVSIQLHDDKPHTGFSGAIEHWLTDHIGRAASNPTQFLTLVFAWAHRLAVLVLPILATVLALLYWRRKELFFFDHLTVAMQYLAFYFLLWTVLALLPASARDWLDPAARLWLVANLYLILRDAYRSSVVGAIVKSVAVWCATVIVFVALVSGLMLLALQQV